MFDDLWSVPPEERTNTDLIATLDDVVQAMCRLSHEEWAQDNSPAHQYFNKIKKELQNRLK